MATRLTSDTIGWLQTLCRDGAVASLSDQRLLERFMSRPGAGGEIAFEAIVRRHGAVVLGVCRAILRDPDEADDAFQATFLVLARRATTIREHDCLATWLRRVARRIAVRSRVRSLERMNREHLPRSTNPAGNPAAALMVAETQAQVRSEVGRLAATDRRLLELTYWQGKTYEEAAAVLTCPVGTVRSKLARARDRLRARMVRLGVTPSLAVLGLSLTARHARAVQPLESLVRQTVVAGSRFGADVLTAVEDGVVPASVAALVKGEVSTMLTFPWKSIAALLCAGGVLGAGITSLAFSAAETQASGPAGLPVAAEPAQAPAPPVALQAQQTKSQAKSLLANGGAEDGEEDLPTAWSRGQTVIGVDYIWSHDTAHSGKSSLCMKKTQNRYFPIAQWQQQVSREGNAPRLKVSAWVKADKTSKAIFDVQFVDNSGQWSHAWAGYIGAKQPNDKPVTHDWKRYEGVVAIPENTMRIIVAPQIYGPGTVWFDDMSAEYTNDPATDPLGS